MHRNESGLIAPNPHTLNGSCEPIVKSNTDSKGFRYDINALRAFAVLAVVAYHFGLPEITGGFAGVDVFFVISGFLITSQIQTALKTGSFSFKDFYIARLRRIFPALAVVCIASLAWGWFYVLPYDYRSFSRHALAALFFVSNIAFTGEHGYFDISAHSKPLLHTWSLSLEGQFYLFLPLYLSLLWRLNFKRIIWAITAVSLASLAWCFFEADQVSAFYLLTGRAWEFLTGALLSCFRIPNFSKNWKNAIGLLGMGVLACSFIFLDAALWWPGLWTLIPVLAVAALLMVPDASVLKRLLTFWPIQRIGDLSYSLYLWHWPVLVYGRQFNFSTDQTLSSTYLAGLLALTFILSTLSWRYVELPIRQRRDLWSNKRLAWSVVLTVVACLAFTLTEVATKGLPQRFPDYVRRAFPAVTVDTPRPECIRDENSRKKAAEQFCLFGNKSISSEAPSLLLWGDSHANQYLDALMRATTRRSIVGAIATQTECRPEKARITADIKSVDGSSCDKFNIEVNSFIEKTPSIHTVVLGRLWRNGANFGDTVALAKSLTASGKKVILLGPLPAGTYNVPDHWSQLQLIAGHRIDDMTVTLSSQEAAQKLLNLLKSDFADELGNGSLILIDPFQTLCDLEKCYLVKNGVALIRDWTHLSQAGSWLFASDFSAAIDKLTSPVDQSIHKSAPL